MIHTVHAPVEPDIDDEDTAAEELAARLLEAGAQSMELFNVYLGHTLGLYRHLAQTGPLTSAQLAEQTALDERYVREWLQGQIVSGFLTAPGTDLRTTHVSLAPGARAALVDELSPTYLTPLSQFLAGTGTALPHLLQAFRTGEGVPYTSYGPEAVSGQAALNRPAYTHDLVNTWLPAIPQLTQRLADSSHPARVADLGCGAGWAAIALATAYPHLHITGLDADNASLAQARHNATTHNVADRITFQRRDLAADDLGTAPYDVVLLFESLHDFAYPDRVLRNVRNHLSDDGWVIVMDENVDEELAPSDDPVQRLFSNTSPLWSLPQGRPAPDAHPIGTVMRPQQLRDLARDAGFTDAPALPIQHPFWRFYRLTT